MSDPVPDLLSHDAFLIVLWVSVGILTVVFTIRAYIRYVCFGHLLLEDWLVAVALVIFIASTVLWQIYLQGMYDMVHYAKGTFVPGPTFLDDTAESLRAVGASAILVYVALWSIKASFLVLFYRLGHQIPTYRYVLWVCSVIIMACGAVGIGLSQYSCMFADIETIFATCTTSSTLHGIFAKEVAASVLDIVSDLLIIIFPIWILARTTLSLRQKVVFSGVFCLVGLTVAITIVRGAFSKIIDQHPAYALEETNIYWPFWFTIEFITSFLVACAVSFRSLFVQKRNKVSLAAEANRRRQAPASSNGKASDGKASSGKGRANYYLHKLHMSFLTTAHDLEGTSYEHETWNLPNPASGTMTVDFSKDEGWRRVEEDGESMRALRPLGQRYAAETSSV